MLKKNKTYLLVTQIINGEVTISIHIIGIRAKTFIEAKKKAKFWSTLPCKSIEIKEDNIEMLSFYTKQPDRILTSFSYIKNAPLRYSHLVYKK